MNKSQILNTMLSAGLAPSTPLPQALDSLDAKIDALKARIRQDSKDLADLHEARDFLAANRPKPANVHLRPEHATISPSLSCAGRLLAYLEAWQAREQPLTRAIPDHYTNLSNIR